MAVLAAEHGYSAPVPLSSGVEFLVFRSRRLDEDVVFRVPRARTFHTANNVGVSPEALLEQELRIARWLAPAGFPVAEAMGIEYTGGGMPVLISQFIASDPAPPDWSDVGALLARLHAMQPPDMSPVVQYGRSVPELLAERLPSRFAKLLAIRPELGQLPDRTAILSRLTRPGSPAVLLHLDVRRQNLLCAQGRVKALIDWSNVLIGDPALELARMSEYARIEENGLDEGEIRWGYHRTAGRLEEDPVTDLLYRLDAAVMLALVFNSVAPDPQLGPSQSARVGELLRELEEMW